MNAFAEIDVGGSGSDGPWLNWGAQKERFTLRTREDEVTFDGFASGGVVLDIDNFKTGWCYIAGVIGTAPDWRMNRSITKFDPQPGEEFKKGFKVRCAIGGGKTADWDQSGAGAWNGMMALTAQFAAGQQPGTLPLVKMVGTKTVKFTKGSTVEPVFEITKWVPRPDCLKEGFAAGIATEAPQPVQAPKPAPAPVAALADDAF